MTSKDVTHTGTDGGAASGNRTAADGKATNGKATNGKMASDKEARGGAGVTAKKPVCRVFVADDHAVSKSGIRFWLAQTGAFSVVGDAGDGASALRDLAAAKADILLLDFVLPKQSGLMVLEALQSWPTAPAVVFYSGQSDGEDFSRALRLGALGLVSKGDPQEDLLAALQHARDGRQYVSASVAQLIGPIQAQAPEAGRRRLTQREKQVLALVAEGRTSAWIARELGISEKTVKKHRENIRQKLQVSSAVEATRMAMKLGLSNYR